MPRWEAEPNSRVQVCSVLGDAVVFHPVALWSEALNPIAQRCWCVQWRASINVLVSSSMCSGCACCQGCSFVPSVVACCVIWLVVLAGMCDLLHALAPHLALHWLWLWLHGSESAHELIRNEGFVLERGLGTLNSHNAWIA